jgi:7-keto-8-aminopelargonate synthetase-like enzyme/acyl-CoA synthetase (AMP-forming)/AMP-acid ligase II
MARWEADGLRSLLLARAHADDDGSSIGFWDPAALTWRVEAQRRFIRRAAAHAAHLAEGGVTAGSRVAVACPSPDAALLGFLGSVLAGAVPALVAMRPFDDPAEEAERVRSARTAIGSDVPIVCEASGGVSTVVVPERTDAILLDPAAGGEWLTSPLSRLVRDRSDDLCHLQLTSGSTSAKRAVAITNGNLMANCAALSHVLPVTEQSVMVSWLPLHHDMGLVGIVLLALVHGLDLFLMSPVDFVRDPMLWLRAISEHGGSITASPTFGYERCRVRATDEQLAELQLSTLRSACCGAEPVSAGVAAGFTDRFAPCGLPPTAFSPCYGLAEATLVVSMKSPGERWRSIRVERSSLATLGQVATVAPAEGPPPPDQVDVVALGPVVDGLDLAIVDEAGAVVHEPLVCGEIVLGGPSVSAGYVDGGDVQRFDDGGLRTGDVGFFEGGELYVVERLKDIVIRNGQNYSVHVFEQTLARQAGARIEDVVVLDADVDRADELVGIVAVREDVDPEPIAAAVRAGRGEYELPLDVLLVVPRGQLPRTTSGKKQHAATRERLRAGRLDVRARYPLRGTRPEPAAPADAGHDDVARIVLDVVAGHARARGFDGLVLGASDLAYDLDFDSLAVLELFLAVEERLGVSIPEEALRRVHTVDELTALVASGGAADGTGVGSALEALGRTIPQTYRTVHQQRGREVVIDGRRVVDLASCNYLGLDLHPDVLAAVPPLLDRWGAHPSWTRAVASPEPYRVLETRLAELLGVPLTVVFPTVTLAHIGVLPKLAGPRGGIVIDAAAHHSLQEAAILAKGRGTAVAVTRHGDVEDVEARLTAMADRPARVIVVDGVYSMSGNAVDLAPLVELADRHDATVYVDDAHGFGVLGERPGPGAPYGSRGNGVVRYRGLDYHRIVYVGGMSKAYSSLAAFVTCADEQERQQLEAASTMVFSGPIPVASLATALAGLEVNVWEGDELRSRVWSLTQRLLDGVRDLGLEVDNDSGFPIVNVVLGPTEVVTEACRVLWDHGVLLTPAVFPAAPLDRGGVRLTPTAANTEEQVDRALAGLREVRDTLCVRAAPSTVDA